MRRFLLLMEVADGSVHLPDFLAGKVLGEGVVLSAVEIGHGPQPACLQLIGDRVQASLRDPVTWQPMTSLTIPALPQVVDKVNELISAVNYLRQLHTFGS